MNKWIAPDGPILQFFSDCLDIIIVSVLFTLTSLPLVTLGCSHTAMYYALSKVLIKREGKIYKEYFKAFRDNFKESFLTGIIFILFLISIFGSLWYDLTKISGNAGMIFGALFMLILIIIMIIMAFSYLILSAFECDVFMLLQSALAISFTNLWATIQIAVMEIMLFAGLAATVFISPVFVMFLPGVLGLGQLKVIAPILKKYMPEGEKKSKTGWDEE